MTRRPADQNQKATARETTEITEITEINSQKPRSTEKYDKIRNKEKK